MAQLRFIDDQGVLTTRILATEKFVVGRVESCQLCIVDDLISREHARFDQDPDGRYRVRDLGSRNKTFVNGEQITETLLSHGDMVRIGGRVFEFAADNVETAPFDLTCLTPDRSDPPGTQWIKIKSPITMPLNRVGELALLGAEAPFPSRAEDVAAAVLSRVLINLNADRGFIALRGENKREIHPLAHRGLTREAGGSLTPISQAFVYSALLQSVAGKYPEQASQTAGGAGFATTGMVAPLVNRNSVAGIIYVDRPKSGEPFSAEQLQELAAAGASIGAMLADSARRLSENVAQITAPWLKTLRRLQTTMTVPLEPGTSLDLAAKTMPGQSRCGDFVDVFHLDEHRSAVLLVDAGGHGVSGFIHAQGIRTSIHAAFSSEKGAPEIEQIITAINRSRTVVRARQLVTVALVVIDLDRGQIQYINAGAPPPLLLAGKKRLVTLDQPSLLLGIDSNYGYEVSSAELPAAFRLICHSDGLTDCTNAAGDAFGAQRLHDLLLQEGSFTSAVALVDRIVAACDLHRAKHPFDDDATVVVISHG